MLSPCHPHPLPFPCRPLPVPSLPFPDGGVCTHGRVYVYVHVRQAKEMLLMAEEAVGDRKLEGRLTLGQLRRYLSSGLHKTPHSRERNT